MLLIVVYFVSRDADRSRGGRKTKMPSYLKSLLQQHRSEFDSSAAWLAVEVFDNDFSFQKDFNVHKFDFIRIDYEIIALIDFKLIESSY